MEEDKKKMVKQIKKSTVLEEIEKDKEIPETVIYREKRIRGYLFLLKIINKFHELNFQFEFLNSK